VLIGAIQDFYQLLLECIEGLEKLCRSWHAGGFRNPNKCRDYYVQMLKSCNKVYSYVYEGICGKRLDFAMLRSLVGQILSTYYSDLDRAYRDVVKLCS